MSCSCCFKLIQFLEQLSLIHIWWISLVPVNVNATNWKYSITHYVVWQPTSGVGRVIRLGPGEVENLRDFQRSKKVTWVYGKAIYTATSGELCAHDEIGELWIFVWSLFPFYVPSIQNADNLSKVCPQSYVLILVSDYCLHTSIHECNRTRR